ncbi:hypothetical protein BS47DRAFT_1342001 [Hydnum rufescens UP504]|uniref:GTP-binding protein n=1 Tax=Hydnum rufescens UP504 TaxID=1448309 RepID=A0A9P6B0X1_9AGAM|nr:hypothetical protein BS47DRAFT_1342001 [Hydnum rufescens UP504]
MRPRQMRPSTRPEPDPPRVPSAKSLAGSKDPHRRKILVLGLRRAGKTAIQEVVFHGMSPRDTFFIEPTFRVSKEDVNTIIPLQLWDCPGGMPVENLDVLLDAFSTLVFVIDIQDEYSHAISKLVHLMAMVYTVHPLINIEVFVHKAESMSEDYKIDNFRQLQERVYDETIDHPLPLENLQITFHLTSVYDHTIYEAWSRVIQKLIPPLAALENLLNVLCSNSGLSKAFLFDIKTLTHVAADESPPDATTYGLCCEYIQTLLQFSNLYKYPQSSRTHQPLPPPQLTSTHTPSSSIPARKGTQPLSIPNSKTSRPPPANSTHSSAPSTLSNTSVDLDPADSRVWSTSSVRLKPQTTLAYWEITNQLSLVALIRSETYEASQGLIDYNVTFFRKAIHRIVDIEKAKWPSGD